MIRRILTAFLFAVALIAALASIPGLLENIARACEMGVNC